MPCPGETVDWSIESQFQACPISFLTSNFFVFIRMNQLCRVCGEPAAGFHFGAFTCEGCKSFFGRTYNNPSQIHDCKNGGTCVINKQNRTSCKACRLKKCVVVGMSKSGSKYGRRSNWFKIHCLLQEQAAHVSKNLEGHGAESQGSLGGSPTPMSSISPPQVTSFSPCRTEDEIKVETSALSSPESVGSEGGLDWQRKRVSNGLLVREPLTGGGDFVANLGLYSFHPGLSSLLHASQLYSRLYPPALYPAALAHTPLLPPTPISASPPRSASPPKRPPLPLSPDDSPRAHTHSPPFTFQTGVSPISSSPFSTRKRSRMAHSPIGDLLRPWHQSSSPTEQEAPIDLRVKRRRLSTHNPLHSPSPTPATPDTQGHLVNILPLVPPMGAAPVNLSSKA